MKAISEETKNQILKKINEGLRYIVIAEHIGVSPTTVSVIAKQNGFKGLKFKKLNKDDLIELKTKIKTTNSYTILAKEYGVSRQYVSSLAKEIGMKSKRNKKCNST
jgi:hypothetical protein